MRPRPSWAGQYDDLILEYLQETESALPPAVVAFNLDWQDLASPAHSTVKRRLRVLEDHCLVIQVEERSGYYAISEKGRKYLAGDLTLAELEADEDED